MTPVARLAADALGGRVGRDELGVLLLQRAELAEERVELGVADLGIVEDVVAVVVRVNLAGERGVARAGLFRRRGHAGRERSAGDGGSWRGAPGHAPGHELTPRAVNSRPGP